MRQPKRHSFFQMDNPKNLGPAWMIPIETSTQEIKDIVASFPGITSPGDYGWFMHAWIDANYDHEEVWLLLYDALQEANNRLMADERLSDLYELDELDTSGI